MKANRPNNEKITLNESASLLFDLFSDDFASSARLFGAELPGFQGADQAKNVLAFLDGTDVPLSQIVKELPVGGTLALVFDNRYGFRFLSGLASGESKEAFQGLEEGEGYSLNGVRKALAEQGIKDLFVYFPFPDYRFPKIIYSEGLLPEKGSLRNLIGGVGKDRIITFDEEKAFDAAIDSGDFATFAPCYLIVAKKEGK